MFTVLGADLYQYYRQLPDAAPRVFSFWPPSPESLDPFFVFQDGIRPTANTMVVVVIGSGGEEDKI